MAIKDAKLDYLFPEPIMTLELDEAEKLNLELLTDIQAICADIRRYTQIFAKAASINRSNSFGS